MTSNSKELIDLAERCEKATGPDRKLDRLISLTSDDWDERARINPPIFTSSLDAAMTLVPEGVWSLRINIGGNIAGAFVEGWFKPGLGDFHGSGRTNALALCAAALRARVTQSPVDETDHA